MIENLLHETLTDLSREGLSPDDVRFVRTKTATCDWPTFARYAETCNYYAGYGTNTIHYSLVIVGDDWWLERGEYDGSEWWEFKRKPEQEELPLLTYIDLLQSETGA